MTKTQKPRRLVPPPKKASRPSPVTAAQLLLEIGVEELPYQFIAPALAVLKDSAEQLFKDQRLAFQSVRTLGTPTAIDPGGRGSCDPANLYGQGNDGAVQSGGVRPCRPADQSSDGICRRARSRRPRPAGSPDSEGGVSLCREAGTGAARQRSPERTPPAVDRETLVSKSDEVE